MQVFAPPSTPFLWLSLVFGLLALLTLAGWTAEFRAHRATFTVHARSGSASRQRHLVLLDLAAGLHRPRRSGISILNSRRQLFRVGRDFADS